MNRIAIPLCLFAATLLAAGIFAPSSVRGQTTRPSVNPPSTPPAPSRKKAERTHDMLELSPFVVEASRDDSYGAINSNSITSFNTELEKLPISADVITKAFMDDTNSTTLENMLREYSAGAGTGSAAGDPGGIPVNQPLDRGGGEP